MLTSLIESPLQDALEGEGDKLEALARVELVLKLNPATETDRQDGAAGEHLAE